MLHRDIQVLLARVVSLSNQTKSFIPLSWSCFLIIAFISIVVGRLCRHRAIGIRHLYFKVTQSLRQSPPPSALSPSLSLWFPPPGNSVDVVLAFASIRSRLSSSALDSAEQSIALDYYNYTRSHCTLEHQRARFFPDEIDNMRFAHQEFSHENFHALVKRDAAIDLNIKHAN